MATASSQIHYLEKYAEIEAIGFNTSLFSKTYHECVVIPLYGEGHWINECFDSLKEAAEARNLLAIVVLNSHEKTSPEIAVANEDCLKQLMRYPNLALNVSPPHRLFEVTQHLDLLLMDHTQTRHQFLEAQGVGMARKLGMDTAVFLRSKGILQCRYLHTTDGDALLDPDYFHVDENQEYDILLHPFRHLTDYEHSEALKIYEASLRYYVLGMRWAHSPYAFHTIGSTIAITPECYSSVRGFPKRNAAEDFYLLNKAAKTGRVKSLSKNAIRLIGRKSDRVPFGTGTGTLKIWNTQQKLEAVNFYAPQSFDLLKFLIIEFEIYSNVGNLEASLNHLSEEVRNKFNPKVERNFKTLLTQLEIPELLLHAYKSRRDSTQRLRHIHEAFDAFRTLKFIHAVRDTLFPAVDYRVALKIAPFTEMTHLELEKIIDELISLELKNV